MPPPSRRQGITIFRPEFTGSPPCDAVLTASHRTQEEIKPSWKGCVFVYSFPYPPPHSLGRAAAITEPRTPPSKARRGERSDTQDTVRNRADPAGLAGRGGPATSEITPQEWHNAEEKKRLYAEAVPDKTSLKRASTSGPSGGNASHAALNVGEPVPGRTKTGNRATPHDPRTRKGRHSTGTPTPGRGRPNGEKTPPSPTSPHPPLSPPQEGRTAEEDGTTGGHSRENATRRKCQQTKRITETR